MSSRGPRPSSPAVRPPSRSSHHHDRDVDALVMIEDCRAMPDPPPEPTPAEAREFVSDHEASLVYNWLVAQNGGPADCRLDGPGSDVSSVGVGGATRVEVESIRSLVVAESDVGYYVVSSCSGRAEYWCRDERRSCASAGRNAHFVTHYVGDGRHVRIPHNWFACHVREEPYRAPGRGENVSVRGTNRARPSGSTPFAKIARPK